METAPIESAAPAFSSAASNDVAPSAHVTANAGPTSVAVSRVASHAVAPQALDEARGQSPGYGRVETMLLSPPPGDEGHATSEDEDALGDMNGRWITMSRDCYTAATMRLPGLEGKIDFQAVVVGDAAMGGVVESVTRGGDSTIDDPQLAACLRETILSLQFPPPRGGNWYRFDFQGSFGADGG